MNTPASPKITLAFGHAQLAKSVANRIRKHFAPEAQRGHRSPVEQSLVVGVFGEWGSGKSSLLHAVKQDFEQQQDETAPVVTVFFNAWRYEKEPHLIVPLLKKVQAEIKRVEADAEKNASRWSKISWISFKEKLTKTYQTFGNAALAFASAYEATVTFKGGEYGIPFEFSLKTSPKAALEMFRASEDLDKKNAPKPEQAHYAKLDEYDTLYLEFERQLRELTDSDPALNLLFFIDDLDRCLPEKALEMLEAIKLFFDVPRCVFVLAVDDEVVERGVQHRYRDYLFEASKAASADASHRLPITGAEYLEKIIHLPLRLPPAQTGQAEQFLRERYPELFDYQATHREYLALAPKALEEEHEAARQRLARRQAKVKDGHDEPERDEAETTAVRHAKQLLRHAQQQRDLCQLFARAVPPVPRKLQRAAELLHMLLDASQQLGLGIDQQPSKTLLLARLAIWQCFAPELFRLCRRQPSRFLRIAQWFADGQHDFGLIDTDENTEKNLYGESRGEALAALKDLRRRVAASRRQRSEFDLHALFTAYPSDFNSDEDHAKLRQGDTPLIPAWHDPALPGQLAQLGIDTAIDELILQAHSAHPGQHAGVMYGRVADVDEFLQLLFSNNPADQQDALHNRLQGGPLPPPLVERVVRHDGFTQSSPHWLGQLLTQLAPLEARALPPVLVKLATHRGWLTACAFSPDGQHILTASHDNTAKLWDAHSGALLCSFDGHTDWVNSCAFSPDGQHILTASDDNTAKLWDTHSGALLRSFDGHTDLVNSCTFSLDGQHILTASNDKTAKLWDAHSGALLRSFDGHTRSVDSCAFSTDGQHILTASDDNTAKLWDAHSGALLRSFDGHTRSVDSCAFSTDGQHILTASRDHTAKLWDAHSGALLRSFDGHTDWVRSCAFSPDGQHILTASNDKTAKLWDAHSGALLRSFDGHTRSVDSCAFSTDGQHILTASRDHTAKLWDAHSGALLRSFDGHARWVNSCAFSPDGQRILTSCDDKTAKLWNAHSGALLRSFDGHTDSVRSCALTPDGQHVLTASADNTAKLWDAHSGALLRSFDGHTAWVNSCAFSPDSQHILTASGDKTARLWDAHSGKLLRSFDGHTSFVLSCAFSPDGQHILTASHDHTAKLWDAHSGALLRSFDGHTRSVNSCTFSPDGQHILTASDDNTAKLWDTLSGALLRSFDGHTDLVNSCTFSLDGQHILTASRDHTTKLWDAHPGALLRSFDGHAHWVNSSAFSPDGQHILTASNDCTTRLWDASTGELIHTLFISQTDNLALSWPARLQDFQGRRCTLRAIDPDQPIDLSKPRNWILQDQRLAERQPVRTWPLDVLISRYGDDESQALLAQAQAGDVDPNPLPSPPGAVK
ncbi:P-loop NTPase fold protein [Rivihabitans pingtungensis]|uniref:WD40 repeat-containing protein SMU1 n=1 Tax=Rivihabitans pingtungensis TaxID=1054498 RepID=A0A318KRH8_9NEIS|nr:P-loop NTPase fold protein [Rivihabitans pingtungensis]PXX79222.1 WD40 repeat protein [Rivihabitans pingtungensis]